jgi:hypothetical protein
VIAIRPWGGVYFTALSTRLTRSRRTSRSSASIALSARRSSSTMAEGLLRRQRPVRAYDFGDQLIEIERRRARARSCPASARASRKRSSMIVDRSSLFLFDHTERLA